ncbi:MAG: phage portal protein [Planctomycetota bacterium]
MKDPTLAEAFDGLRSDYAAAKQNRFRRRRTGIPTAGAGADFHYRSEADWLRMLEYARDFERNDVVVGPLLNTAVNNTIQDGFVVNPETGDSEFDRELTTRWDAWAQDADQCDLAGELTFWDMEQLVLRQTFADGDILGLPNRDTGAVELVEAHRCRTPKNTKKNVVHGIELDATTRKRLRYWLTRDDVDPSQALDRVSDCKQYDARDDELHRQVFHVYVSKRVSQTRGITAFAPIFDQVAMFEDINFAKLVHQQVVSCFAVFRQREAMFAEIMRNGMAPPVGEATTETLASGVTRVLQGVAPGMEIASLPGERLEMSSPNVPNPEFFPHVKLILTLIGINLGLPLVMVLMDAGETNFSGWRGAVDQARMGFKANQRRMKTRWHSPIYCWKVRHFLATDPVLRRSAERQGINPFAHKWIAPTWPYIQPLQDAQADLLRRRNGLTSGRRWAAERNMNYDDLTTEIVEDNAQMIERAWQKAEDLKKRCPGIEVTWREVACLPTPDGVTISAQPQQNPQAGRSNQEPENAAA